MNTGTIIQSILIIAILGFVLFCMWKVFEKMDEPGWKALIPVYNIIVILEKIGRPVWWVILFFIPCVNIVIGALISMDLGQAFGKEKNWGLIFLFLISPVGYYLLAFGPDKYKGAQPK